MNRFHSGPNTELARNHRNVLFNSWRIGNYKVTHSIANHIHCPFANDFFN